jgi:hypothetical protein
MCRSTAFERELSSSADADVCSGHSWQVPAMLLLPYIWRLVQCIIIARQTNNQDQLYNACKYFSAFPVVCLSFVKYSVEQPAWDGFWKPLWMLAAFFNTCFSYYWDLEHDWDIKLFTAYPGVLLDRLVSSLTGRDKPSECINVSMCTSSSCMKSVICIHELARQYVFLNSQQLGAKQWTYRLAVLSRGNLYRADHVQHCSSFVRPSASIRAVGR